MTTLSTHEAATLLGVTPDYVIKLVASGRLAATREHPRGKSSTGPNGTFRFTLRAVQACRKRTPLKRGPKCESSWWIRPMRKSGPKREGEEAPNGHVGGPFDSAKIAEEVRKRLPNAYALVVVREKKK
jgi:excisionase family DNA binding protein